MSLGITRSENGGRDYTAEFLKAGREGDRLAQEQADKEFAEKKIAKFNDSISFVVSKLETIFDCKNAKLLADFVKEMEYSKAMDAGYSSQMWDVASVLIDGQYESDDQLLSIFNQ